MLLQERGDLPVVFGAGQGQRVFKGHGHVTDAKQGVVPSGENPELVIAAGDGEIDFHPLRTAYPVALHGAHRLGPAGQVVQFAQQLLVVSGDLQKPLGYFLSFHHRAGAPAPAVYHLLVGQHGLVHRIPVDRRCFFIHQTFFVQFGEKPLLPAVVIRFAGGKLPVPVIREPQPLQLLAHVIDVLVSPLRRRHLVFYRRVFGGQAEGVPAHGLQHILAPHALVAGDDISDGVIAHMSDVQFAARVGKHGQAVEFFPAWILDGLEGAILFPEGLNFSLDAMRLVSGVHSVRVGFVN